MSCKYFYFSSISTFFLEKVKKCKKILPPRAKDFLKIGHFSGHFYFYFFQKNIKNVSIIHHISFHIHKIMVTKNRRKMVIYGNFQHFQ
jgi:hypothetical protein